MLRIKSSQPTNKLSLPIIKSPLVAFNSIKLRLALLFTGIFTILLLIIFSYLYYYIHKNINDEALRIIDERVLVINDILKDEDLGLKTLKNNIEKEWVSPQHEPLWIQVRFPDGKIFAESPQFSLKTGNEFFQSEQIIKINNPDAPFSYIKVSLKLDRSSEDELVLSYGRQMLIILMIALVFTIYLIFKVLNREFEPLIKMSRKMKNISLHSLHRRINSKRFPQELVTLADSFNSMLIELEKSFEQVSRFSADIAHELRTPLNALMIKIEVMMEKPRSTEEYQDLLDSLYNDTKGLSKLIDTLLFLARTENPSRVLHFESVNINEEIKSLIEFYEPLACEKNIQIQFEEESTVVLPVEKSLFDRAIGNLIQNAIQYCNQNCLIKIKLHKYTEKTCIEISDNGPGIGASHMPYLFDRLYRVDSSRNPQSGGLGLGLSIVASIMKLHGGQVKASSEPNKGTSFQLILSNQITN